MTKTLWNGPTVGAFGLVLLFGFFLGYIVGERQVKPANPTDPHAGVPGAPPLSGEAAKQPVGAGVAPTTNPQLVEQLRAVEELLAKEPHNYEHLVQAGNLLFDMNNFLRAAEYYERATVIRDDSPDLITDLGVCYREMGNPQRALELFEKAASLNSEHWQSRYNAVIVRLFDLNDPRGAQAELTKLKASKSQNAPDLSGLEQEIARRLGSSSN